MAEIRCPMCGKTNPENLAVCQFCEARLEPLGSAPPPAEKQQDDSSSDQDWLHQMRFESNIENSPFSETESGTPEEEGEEFAASDQDWLQRLQALHPPDQETGSKPLSGDEAPKVSPFDAAWEDENQRAAATSHPDDNTTQDLTGGQETLPDWLKRIGSQTEEDDVSAEIQPTGLDEDEEEQDWFSEIVSSAPAGEPISQNQEEELPDWLSGLGFGNETTGEVSQASEPDWLSRSVDEAAPTVLPTQSQDEASSDWFTDAEIDSLEAIEPPANQRPGDQVPDWLQESSPEPGKTKAEEEPSQADEEDLMNWLSELDKVDETESSAGTGSSTEDMPGWLKSLGSVVTGTVEDESLPDLSREDATPFIGQDEFDEDLLDVESLPAWLTPESLPPEEEVEDSGLAVAELPGWLEAMRPIERESPGIAFENGLVESAGPLAGLRAVLPAEPEIGHYRKPPIYVAKLRVTDNQLAQADIIRRLVSHEGDTEPIPETPMVSPQRALRWLTALIVFIVIGFVVISGSQFIPLPDQHAIPDAIYHSNRIISALPDQALVLVAFDYEPGTAGEMHAAAAALVDHLMLKAARLTLVSTLPSGPALAEYFMQTVQSQHNYTSGLQYINLGYIPGGATGLLSFSQTPQWVFPQSYDGFSPWETPPLQDIRSLSDFNLVVVITDDTDTARSWIEQVRPGMRETPLLMVTSAQAEPMVRPYYGSLPDSQVNGIVSGLSGGAAYEVMIGKANLGRTYWDAFSIGLLMAVCAILIGGITSVAKRVLTYKKFKGEEK